MISTLYNKNYYTVERQGLPHHRLIEKMTTSTYKKMDSKVNFLDFNSVFQIPNKQ